MAVAKTPRKAKTKRKASSKRKSAKHINASRDWSRIKARWYKSPLTLTKFILSERLARSTALKYLSTKEKNRFLAESDSAQSEFRKQIIAAGAKENGRLYVAAMKRVYTAFDRIVLDAAVDWSDSPEKLEKRDAARITIAAGEALIKLSGELQGIPQEADDFGWPLTKGFSPFSYQRAFVLDTPATIKLEEGVDIFVQAFIGGVGSGKTYCGAQKAGQIAWLNRGCVGIISAPTYKMLEDSTKVEFFNALREKGLSFRYLKQENAIILFGDTKILFRSMDDAETLRGPTVAWVWIDEGAKVKSRTAFDVLNARIRDPKAKEKCLILTSTPDGLNWLYEVVVTEADANRVRLYRARTEQNPLLDDYFARLKASYDPRFAKQELLAEFLNVFAGQAYWNFSPTESVFAASEQKLHTGLPLQLCCDFNVSPMCWNVMQNYKQDGETYTYGIDELHIDTAGTQIAAIEFCDRYHGFKPLVQVYGDATAQHRSTSATRSDYEIIEKTLKDEGFDVEINIGRSNPRETERIAAFNARLLDANETRKLFISKKCKKTIIDLERVGFLPGTRKLDKSDGQLTHHSDAIGYMVHKLWPIRGPKIEQRGRR